MCHEISEFYQVEATGGQGEVESDLLKAHMSELPESSDDLCPTEEFLDFLSIFHALLVGVVPSGATVNRCPLLFAGNMRRNLEFAHVLDKVRGIKAFVGSYGDTFGSFALLPFHHFLGSLAFGGPISLGYLNLGDEAVVILIMGVGPS